MDEQISTFCAFTSATPEQAQQFLALSDNNVEQAVELFFNNPDLATSAAPPSTTAPQPSSVINPIQIDDDDDDIVDPDIQMTGSRAVNDRDFEDDEAMARRLQEEMYGGSGGPHNLDQDEIRAPMARTTETLVGPGSDWRDDPAEMNAAVFQQLQSRNRTRPGIFNQRETTSIWANEEGADPERRRQVLSRATGGASEQGSKSSLLADLFRPPFDLISHLPWSAARDAGKEDEKWLLVNVQDPSIFDCQVLNRDIWKNASIRDTIKEHFIFLQYNKDDPRGQEYVQYYFAQMRDSDDAYPHIAIVDPRTGEQVKTWSGTPAPKANDFLMDLHEFLDRYSLKMERKNPVQSQRKESKKEVERMTEEEMLEMALQNSLQSGAGPKAEDPDALTRPTASKGKEPISISDDSPSPAETAGANLETSFDRISSTAPHEEPTSTDPKETTRIQFRYSGGRVVRRFALTDPVRRIYEWIKAAPFEGMTGVRFELISMGKNLMESLETTIGDAGLRNGTVMVEFLSDD